MSTDADREYTTAELVPVGALNQYLYCSRRYWYYRFYDPSEWSPELVDGRRKHDQQTRQSGWVREQYRRSPELGLHGRVDVLDSSTDAPHPVPVERKRASSGRYYWNDEVQLAAYCLLVEHTDDDVTTVDQGVIYLYETDERHRIEITNEHRRAVRKTRDAIQNLSPTTPPAVVENRNKCRGCSARALCQPATEQHLKRHTGDSAGGEQ